MGYGEAHSVGTVGSSIIGGGKVVVHQAEGSGELGAAIDAHAGWVDADGGHIATYRTHGITHAQGFGSALIIGLREQTGIVDTLS